MMAASSTVPGGGFNVLLKKGETAANMSNSIEGDTAATPLCEKRTITADAETSASSFSGTNGTNHDPMNKMEKVGTAQGNSGPPPNVVNNNSYPTAIGGASTDENLKILGSYVEECTIDTNKGISPDNIVDDALLSALSDPRERFGLLRLEQTLCDFMKDTSLSYIQVGGASNSVVIYPQYHHLDASSGTMTPPRSVGVPQLPQQGGGKQSRFQRLCLHRLADRFHIVRENGGECEYMGGPGLIRLVKVPDSRIPKKLLIDLSEDEYSGDNGPTANNMNPSDNATSNNNRGGGPPMVKTPSRKMKIMKRSSSSFGSSGSLKDKSTGTGGGANNNNNNNKGGRGKGVKGKNLSDKEKAYAEARARIFNNEAASQGSDRRPSVNATTPVLGNSAVSSAFSSTVTSPSTTPPPPNSSLASLSPPSSEVALELQQSVSDDPQLQQQQVPLEKSRSAGATNTKSGGGRPVAATSGGVSKATWRNRRQEESDPDFQTRHRISGSTAGWANNGGGGGVQDYGGAYPASMPPYQVPQHFYAAAQGAVVAPQQQGHASYYPPQQQVGPNPYYNSSMPQQQQQPVTLTPPGSGSSTPNRTSAGLQPQQLQQQHHHRSRGYGPPQRQPYSDNNNMGRGTEAAAGGGSSRRHANINSTEEFPALR